MSGSDRGEGAEGLTTALAIIFAIMFVIALAFPPLSRPDKNSSYQSHAAKCADADIEYGRFRSAHVTDSYPAGYSAQESKHEQEIAHWCDLAAQELTAEAGAKSANFTRLAMLAAFLGVGLLLVTVRQTASMLNEARETTRITGDIGQKQVRAYISASMSEPQIWELPGGANTICIGGKVRISNFGSSPAKKLSASVAFSFLGNNPNFLVGSTIDAPENISTQSPISDVKSKMFFMEEKVSAFMIDEAIHALVTVRYDDVFDNPCTDRFFFVLNGGSKYSNWVFDNFQVVGNFRYGEEPIMEWEECSNPNAERSA